MVFISPLLFSSSSSRRRIFYDNLFTATIGKGLNLPVDWVTHGENENPPDNPVSNPSYLSLFSPSNFS